MVVDPDLARDAAGDGPGGLAGALRVLSGPGVLRDPDGGAVTLEALPLVDLDVLRVALAQARAVDEPTVTLPCDNCDARVEVAPAMHVELAPFLDDELDDDELDAPFDFDREHAIPPVRAGRGVARTVRLAPRSVGEAAALLRMDPGDPLEVTPALVAALGVVALGRERRASAIARALASAPDATWDAICDLWDDAHGHARLVASARCPSCGARNDVPAPAERALTPAAGAPAPRPRRRGARPFPDADTFAARAREHAERLLARRRLRGIEIVVDDGVAAVDDGGEPLLGCYTPPHTDAAGVEHPPEIRIFYRTFRAELDADPRFPLDEEIAETIDHELEHHENFLRGDDPLDDEEREAIVREQRRLVGRRESARRGVRALGAELVGFLRVAWPLLAIGAAATYLAYCR